MPGYRLAACAVALADEAGAPALSATRASRDAHESRRNEQVLPMKFQLQQRVAISVSGETGVVIGRAEYTSSENSYLVRYKSADGRAIEDWWKEDALEVAPQ